MKPFVRLQKHMSWPGKLFFLYPGSWVLDWRKVFLSYHGAFILPKKRTTHKICCPCNLDFIGTYVWALLSSWPLWLNWWHSQQTAIFKTSKCLRKLPPLSSGSYSSKPKLLTAKYKQLQHLQLWTAHHLRLTPLSKHIEQSGKSPAVMKKSIITLYKLFRLFCIWYSARVWISWTAHVM